MAQLGFIYDDGGRSRYFSASGVGDCVTRAIAITLGRDYKEVYREIAKILGYTPRNGVNRRDTYKLMAHYGFNWTPTMQIGKGCKVHLAEGEIPSDKAIICNVSGHVTSVKFGVIHDLYDPSRGGTRCVYGYWTK